MADYFESILTGSSPDPAAPTQADNVYRWGTVTAVSPLQVRLDGDAVPLASRPDSLVDRLTVGQRVWCQIYRRRVLVLGSACQPQDYGWKLVPLISFGGAITVPVKARREGDVIRFTGRGTITNPGFPFRISTSFPAALRAGQTIGMYAPMGFWSPASAMIAATVSLDTSGNLDVFTYPNIPSGTYGFTFNGTVMVVD